MEHLNQCQIWQMHLLVFHALFHGARSEFTTLRSSRTMNGLLTVDCVDADRKLRLLLNDGLADS